MKKVRRILIIDDEAPVRRLLREMLERAGYNAVAAADGNEGLRLQQEEPFDLIITDIIMPDKEGISTIIDLRRGFPDLKIIAMSGGGRIGPDDYLNIAQKLGAHRTLIKPFRQAEVLAAVSDLLNGEPPAA